MSKIQTIPTARLLALRSQLLSRRNNEPLRVRDTLALAAITAELDSRHAR